MPRKRKRAEKTRTTKPKTLEQSLKSGDPKRYGQLCWSLPNRDTTRHKAGDVIKLGGLDPGGRWTERKVRLTEETIENINRCLGMRTCGEASAFSPHRRRKWNPGENAHMAINKPPGNT